MVEVEQEQRAGALRLERIAQGAHQLAAVGEARRRIGIGVTLGKALGLVVGFERFLEVLRAAPAEQDDRNVEQEGNGQRPVVRFERQARDCARQHLAAQPDEQDDRRDGRAGRDQMAARNPHSLAPRIRHQSFSFTWSPRARIYQKYVKNPLLGQ